MTRLDDPWREGLDAVRIQAANHRLLAVVRAMPPVVCGAWRLVMEQHHNWFEPEAHGNQDHVHPFWEAALQWRGRMAYRIGQRTRILQPDLAQVALMPAGVPHARRGQDPGCLRPAFLFRLEATGPATATLRTWATTLGAGDGWFRTTPPPLKMQLRLLAEEVNHPHGGHTALVEALLRSIAVLLLRAFEAPLSEVSAIGQKAGGLVAEISAIIAQQGDRALRLEHIAERCQGGLGVRQLRRRFQQATGVSLGAWMVQQRMEAARVRLGRDDAPVAEVAKALGFADASYFSRAFRRQFGISPVQYRKTRID